MKEETLIDGLAKPMHMIGIKSSDESIQFSAYIGFGKLLTNPLKTDNGQTVGERNRAALHRRLDAWLDGKWKENVDD
jgi:hypothetical protein